MNLTYWLRKSPRPSAILADDKRIEVPNNARAWKDLTATIASLEPSKLTALDGQGNVIRSIVLESDDDRAPPSPEMSDLQLFAKLLAEAYDKGGRANQPIVDSAMGFIDRQGARLAKADAEIERLRSHNHKLQMQIAELTTGAAPQADDSLLGTIMAGLAQGNGVNPLANLAAANTAKQQPVVGAKK
jgi:hypothetical protein